MFYYINFMYIIVIEQLSSCEGIVYLLWGQPAELKCKGINADKNVIITSSHPSPLSATRTKTPFIGSRYDIRINYLIQSTEHNEYRDIYMPDIAIDSAV